MMVDMEKYDDGKLMGIDGLSAFQGSGHLWIATWAGISGSRVNPTSVQGNTNLRIARYYQCTVVKWQALRFSINV